MLVGLAGCGEPPTSGGGRLLGFAVAGDHQSGPPGSTLPIPLEVEVRDGDGLAVARAAVLWEARPNGLIDESDAKTDGAGRARARFVLGSSPGVAGAVARIAGGFSISFTLEAKLDPSELPYNLIVPLRFATFDGSGEVVHPDHGNTPAWAFGKQLVITPYPAGNANFELPSLFSSGTDTDWMLAPGVVTDQNLIYLVRTTNGVLWTKPEPVVAAPNHEVISPAVVRRSANDWWMWSVNGGAAGCGAGSAHLELRRSPDGRTWSAPERLELTHAPLTPWHVDVRWIPTRGEFWALYNVKQPGSCTTPAIFLATSGDGVTWTPAPRPVLVKGQTHAFQDIVYRSTFEYRPSTDDVMIWFSGARYDNGRWTWSGAVERRHPSELFGKSALGDALPEFSPPPADLLDWP